MVIFGALLFELPVALGALVGLGLSGLGSHSRSRRRWAITGMVLSITALVPFLVLMVLFVMGVVYCNAHDCTS